jgi:branched-chain amino acid transport system substrate-binding protein
MIQGPDNKKEKIMFTKKRNRQLFSLIMIGAFMLSACAGATPTSVPTTVPPTAVEDVAEAPPETGAGLECPIVVAAAVHLTGGTAVYDTPPVEGARLAVEQINKEGGILDCEVQLLELDGKSDPAKAGDAAVVAIQQGADVLIAPCDFDMGSPVSIEAQKVNLVGISECASSPLYSSTVLGDKQFTMSPWANSMGAASAEHACKELGLKRGVTITDTFSDFTRSLSRYWGEAYKHQGCELVLNVDYLKGDMTFSSQTEQIRALDPPPDVILLAADMPDMSVITRELRAAGIDAAIVGGDGVDQGEYIEAIGPEAASNLYATTFAWTGPESGEDMKAFLEAFEAKYGKKADTAFYVMGYNLILVLKQAIEKAGTVEGAALARAMENTDFDIVGGTIRWSDAENGHEPSSNWAVVEYQNGERSFWGPYEASWVPPIEREQQ